MNLSALKDLPPALLITGPGAPAAGFQVYARHEALGAGIQVPVLTAGAARDVRVQAGRGLLPGQSFRVFLVRLDGSTEQALNILLKTLEEPPSSARFILTAARPTLVTIASRCHLITLGQPQDREGADTRVHGTVSAAIKAARTGDAALLSMSLRGWDPACTAALSAWAAEAASGRWVSFDAAFAPDISYHQALRVLSVLRMYRGARTAPSVALVKAFSDGRF
jgi:hypothetical protein